MQWLQNWHGDWSLLSCSYFGQQYTQSIGPELGCVIPRCVLVVQAGHSACFFPKDDLDAFGGFLARRVADDSALPKKWAGQMKQAADVSLLECQKTGRVSRERFDAVWDALYGFVGPNLAVKKVVDYLPEKLLKRHLPVLEDARVNAEPVYAKSEEFMRNTFESISKKTGVPAKWVGGCLKKELDRFWRSGALPSESVLEKRFALSVLFFDRGKAALSTGRAAEKIRDSVKSVSGGKLRGHCAYPGVVEGTVRVVLDPVKAKNFRQGDVLVAGMTRPEFLPLMKKASAVVTDAGGILSHAAIVCRELGVPCVVGTLSATTRLKDGDWVVVDAKNGVVRVKGH